MIQSACVFVHAMSISPEKLTMKVSYFCIPTVPYFGVALKQQKQSIIFAQKSTMMFIQTSDQKHGS